MTAWEDKCAEIRLWLNVGEEEYSNALVGTWIAGAEERFDRELRVDDMVEIDTADVNIDRVTVPDRWIEADFIRLTDGDPLVYKDRNSFYTRGDTGEYENLGKYTLTGRYIIVGNASLTSPPTLEMSFYAKIPRFTEDNTWLSTKFPNLLLFGALEQAFIYGIEDERAATISSKLDGMIAAMNDGHKMAKTSGSRLNYKTKRSFG